VAIDGTRRNNLRSISGISMACSEGTTSNEAQQILFELCQQGTSAEHLRSFIRGHRTSLNLNGYSQAAKQTCLFVTARQGRSDLCNVLLELGAVISAGREEDLSPTVPNPELSGASPLVSNHSLTYQY